MADYPDSAATKSLSKKGNQMHEQKGGIVGVVHVNTLCPKVAMRPADGVGGSLWPLAPFGREQFTSPQRREHSSRQASIALNISKEIH